MRSIAGILCIAILIACAAAPACAQDPVPIPIHDVEQRAHITLNSGAMVLTTGPDWSGASVGGAFLYNVHQQLSLFAGYDHGIPLNSVDEQINLYRLVGSIGVHPNASIGFGYAFFDRGIEGGLAQILVKRKIAPRLGLGAMYAHVFSRGDLDDFEYARVYLNYHLLGKE